MDLISVIVPVYNVEDYIEKCVYSIINQTYKNIEVILVDDGSTDKSGLLCDKLSLQNNNVSVIHKKNGGLSSARNAALDMAQGEYISFIDGDDHIKPDMLENLHNACVNYNVPISCCGRYDVYDDKTIETFTLSQPKKMKSEEAIGNLLIWNNIDSSACDKIYKRELFDNIRYPNGKVNEDIAVTYLLVERAGEIVHIGSPEYYYVHRKNSITTNKFSHRNMDLLYISKDVYNYVSYKYKNLVCQAEYFYLNNVLWIFMQALRSENRKDLKKEIKILKKELKKYTSNIINNKYFTQKTKFKSLIYIYIFSIGDMIDLLFAFRKAERVIFKRNTE